MDKSRETIQGTNAKSPVVMFSGGKDSLLTLLLAREVYPDVECIWYRSGSEAQRRSVGYWTMRLNLTVYSHQPRVAYYLPMSESPALVKEYAINDATFPVVAETKHGDICGLQVNEERSDTFLYPWDVTFTGWKDSDTHELANGAVPYAPDGTAIGGSRFFAPIRHMLDDEVLGHLRTLAPEFEDFDDSPAVCTSCFVNKVADVFCPMGQATISVIPWDGQAGLAHFQRRFFGKEASHARDI